MPILLDELSVFFPCHNEAENLEPLVDEALAALPTLAKRFEVIIVDDGSADDTRAVAARLTAAHPGVLRVVHHEVNRGYGAALRTGFSTATMRYIAFTDGDRQFRLTDLSALTQRSVESAARVTVGFRLRRADPLVRTLYAGVYRIANRIFFSLNVRDVDCAMKLFDRSALEDISLTSSGAFFSAELLIKLRAKGINIAEVGVPHFPRTAGSASGARLSVVATAVRDFWSLRVALWLNRDSALRRGEPLV
ncbi:MAG: glycosyltransferase family 2 protein [Chloroflexota bacterium]